MPGPAGSFAKCGLGATAGPGSPDSGHTGNTGDPGITDRHRLAHSDRLTTCTGDEKKRAYD